MKKLFKILTPIIIISLIFVVLFSITNSQNQQSAERKKQQEALQASMQSTEDSIKSTNASKTSSPEDPSSEQNNESTDSKHNKFNLYVFWGDGCPHCENFFNFIKTLPEEYTSLYNLYAFEVWNNQDNSNLMKEFSSVLKADVSSVPFIIIGDQAFKGYSDKTSESIKSAIKAISTKSIAEKSQIDAYQKVLSSRTKN